MPRPSALYTIIALALVTLYFLHKPSYASPAVTAIVQPQAEAQVQSAVHHILTLPHHLHTYSSDDVVDIPSLPTGPQNAAFSPPAWYSELSAESIERAIASLVAMDNPDAPSNKNNSAPIQVLPFYYRAARSPEPGAVTITTLVTPSRYPVLSRLASHYNGPISVAVPFQSPLSLPSLHEFYTSNPAIVEHVDIHLILNSPPRAFNTWRNVARAFARTDTILMLDADFYPCTPFAQRVQASQVALNLLADNAMLVLPAFEYASVDAGKYTSLFPVTKRDLLPLLGNGEVGQFHGAWRPGHAATNYSRFANATAGEVYKVTDYHPSYEPYVIFRRENAPWCDERFVGYGANKAACLFEMYISGRSFYVLADDFMIHQSHQYLESTRKAERQLNKKLYPAFREEICLQYLKHYVDSAIMGSQITHNAKNECMKIAKIRKKFPMMLAGKRLQVNSNAT